MILILLFPAALGLLSWWQVMRYSKVRIEELGLNFEQAHTGRLDDSGTDRFERAMFKEVLQNPLVSTNESTRAIARSARRLTFGAALATIGVIVILNIYA